MRVAMDGSWGNAFAGIVTDDPRYRDATGTGQAQGFSFSVEDSSAINSPDSVGWYSEALVQSVIYDIYDSNDDGIDTLSLGFAPIYTALGSSGYIDQAAFTSIFSFIAELKRTQADAVGVVIDSLLAEEEIFGSGPYGDGETNDGGNSENLPVYKPLQQGVTSSVCSISEMAFDEYNKLGNRQFLRFTSPAAGDYRISVNRTSGTTPSDPDFIVYQRGERIDVSEGETQDQESKTLSLGTGDYILEVYDFLNTDGYPWTGGNVCFDVTIN